MIYFLIKYLKKIGRKTVMKEKREYLDCQALGILDVQTLCFVKNSKYHSPLEMHTHPDQFEICYHFVGSQIYIINDKCYRTKGGDIFISFPNETHSTGPYCEEKSTFYYMIFKLDENTKLFNNFNAEETVYFKQCLFNIKNRQLQSTKRIKDIFKELCNEQLSKRPLMRIKIKSLLDEFFCELFYCCNNLEKEVQIDIQNAIDYLNKYPKLNHTLSDLSAKSYLSIPRFKQKFKEVTGIPPMEFAMRIKINLAKNILWKDEDTIVTIACELGFSSGQHFSSVFKNYTTYTPGLYRKQSRLRNSLL